MEEKEECVNEIKQECSEVPVQNCAEVPVEHSKVISNLVCELQPQRICEEFTNHVCQTIPKNETKGLPTCNCMEETENVCFDVTFQKCEEVPATKLDTREVCVEKILVKEVPEPVLKKEVCHDEIEQKCLRKVNFSFSVVFFTRTITCRGKYIVGIVAAHLGTVLIFHSLVSTCNSNAKMFIFFKGLIFIIIWSIHNSLFLIFFF